MQRKSFRLALLQLLIEPGQRDPNLARGLKLITIASEAGAHAVLLPEAFPLGWMDASAHSEAESISTSRTLSALRAAARERSIHICSGFIERWADKIFNSAVLIDSQGEILLHHRKIHELAIGHALYSLGDRLGVAETDLGRIGLMICADGFAPGQVVSRTLGLMGAQVILSPSAWAVPADHDNAQDPYGKLWLDNYGPVAREFRMWIAGCSNVGPIRNGPWTGHRCIGSSLVVGPDGTKVAQASYGETAEEMLMVEIHPETSARTSAG